MAFALPDFMAIRPHLNGTGAWFMSYWDVDDAQAGYLRGGLILPVVNPLAKFEVEFSSKNRRLVHIRNCRNNKYWERTKEPIRDHFWITCTAEKKEEDESKASCTLFQFFSVNSAEKTVRIMHVHSGCYLVILMPAPSSLRHFRNCVTATYPNHDQGGYDIFNFVDWTSLVILPRFVAFKGDNGKYLRLSTLNGRPHVQFSGDDIADQDVACEILYTVSNPPGNLIIKQISSENFWRLQSRSEPWILASSEIRLNPSPSDVSGPLNARFMPLKINENTIALISQWNEMYAKRLSARRIPNCLNAELPRLTREAWLTVEEAVVRREILRVNYDLENARIYGESIRFVGVGSSTNPSPEPSVLAVKVRAEDRRTTTWRAHFSITLTVKARARAGIPVIADVRVTMSSEIHSEIEWEKTESKTDTFTVTQTTPVPPMTRVTIRAIATEGKCDVPFTFTQRDTLYNGNVVTYDVQGGTFTGANYYNNDFQPTFQPLN